MTTQPQLESLIEEVEHTQRPALVVREGRVVAALIPMADYERFAEWQKQGQEDTRQAQQRRQLQRERAAFEALKPELLKKYADKFVAILDGQLVDVDDDKSTLAKRVYAKFGYRTLLLTEVRETRRVAYFDSPERARH